MHHEIVPRLTTILLHGSEDSVRPTSGLELLQMGNLGVCYSLRGAGFYQALEASGLGPFQEVGVDTVLAAVSPLHYRAMRQGLKHATVTNLGGIRMQGNDFQLVAIRDKAASTPKLFGVA